MAIAAPSGERSGAATAQPETRDDADSATSNIAVSDEIRRACGLSEPETYFAYNSASIDTGSRRILSKLVECFERGPLAGRRMLLVGHADPRGDEEYNYVLGGRRAAEVQKALTQLGLNGERVRTSSQGEIEAVGTDEASWRTDRKVAVLLDG